MPRRPARSQVAAICRAAGRRHGHRPRRAPARPEVRSGGRVSPQAWSDDVHANPVRCALPKMRPALACGRWRRRCRQPRPRPRPAITGPSRSAPMPTRRWPRPSSTPMPRVHGCAGAALRGSSCPFQASDGHTLYRARFGLFAEQEAREVCDRLTQRGTSTLLCRGCRHARHLLRRNVRSADGQEFRASPSNRQFALERFRQAFGAFHIRDVRLAHPWRRNNASPGTRAWAGA